MPGRDAIVLGASLDGLVAACALARAGLKVTLIECLDAPGGAFREAELFPAVRGPVLRHDIERFPAFLGAALGLTDRGLRFETAPASVSIVSGEPFAAPAAPAALRAAIAKLSPEDAASFPESRATLARWANALAPLLKSPPEPPLGPESIARLGERDTLDRIELAESPAAGIAARVFEHKRLAALLVHDALSLASISPGEKASGLLLGLSLAAGRFLAPDIRVAGGVSALIGALVAELSAHGGELRLSTGTLGVVLRGSRARGVTLMGGETLEAPLILSALDPKRTLLALVDQAVLPPEHAAAIRRIRTRGNIAKLSLLLDAWPEKTALSRRFFGLRWSLSGGVDAIADAFETAARGEIAEKPWLDVRASQAGEGAKVLVSALINAVPHTPANGGWTSERRDLLIRRAIAVLDAAVPGLSTAVAGARLLTPDEIEESERIAGGDLMGAALTPSQLLWNRPAPGLSGYVTPIDGLWLCGESQHPGGLWPGLNGWNAAQAALSRHVRRLP